MTISDVEIVGYRSIRKLRLPLRRLTVLTGGNGVGKTNLYRSLELLHAAARDTLADEIAREGGLGSVFWAGGKNLSDDGRFDPKYRTDGFRKGEAIRLCLEARFFNLGAGGDFAPTYRIEVGFPPPGSAAFLHEAQVKRETVSLTERNRRLILMDRDGPAGWARSSSGGREHIDLLASETALASFAGSHSEIGAVAVELANWRFFHGFRTDSNSPLRRPSRAVTSALLNSDGSNLGAVFATLRHIRQDTVDLDAAVENAFPGAELIVPVPGDHASFAMRFPETPKRPFEAHELSDGTLQFLALMGALLSYRSPPFIALNEPETSLHPRLLPALAAAIAKAAERTQVWVVTHSTELAAAIADASGAIPREVLRTDEGTSIRGLSTLGGFDDD